ncbi:Tuberous sclerosis 2-like protein [Coemansia sp. RSA 1200]|nr:Tuberous sclerosis 2-like protein [Coemansia sp. RSA 1200]
MGDGERSGDTGRSVHPGSDSGSGGIGSRNSSSVGRRGTGSISALFRQILRGPFAQDSRGSAGTHDADSPSASTPVDTTAAVAYSIPASRGDSNAAVHFAESPQQEQQQQQQQKQQPSTPGYADDVQVESSDKHSIHSAVDSVASRPNPANFDAVVLARDQPGLLDKDLPLGDRLDALQELAFQMSNIKATNISELWNLLRDIVESAFGGVGVGVSVGEDDDELVHRARILVLAFLAGIAKCDPQEQDFGGDARGTRTSMLEVISQAKGWEETSFALQCVAWASNNAHCLSGDPSFWFELTQRWVKMAVHAQYAELPKHGPFAEETAAAHIALSASLSFFSSIVETEYPVLDPAAVSDAASWLCDQAAQPRMVDEDGVKAVLWKWTEPEHIVEVLKFLKTVITYGAISQDVLLPGIMLLCTTAASIVDCKDQCCEIVRILFTSCYMRDTLLSMNRILRKGNRSLKALPFHKTPTMTPYKYAINGMVYFITQVMDTGPTGFQFSLRTGNCLPVLHKAAQHMHPRVLRLIFPYLCKVVNDDRVDLMLPDDWAVLIGILEDTVECRLVGGYDGGGDDASEKEDGLCEDEGPRPTVAYLYDCALQSIVGVFRRSDSPTPLLLIELLYRMRTVLNDELAQSLLQFIDLRGSLRPGSSDWLETLNEMMHLYYFDRARSVALRHYMIRLCGKIFTESVDIYSSDVERVPILMSVFEQLHLEDNDKIVGHILEMLNSSLRKSIRSDLFSSILSAAARAAIEPTFSRSTSSSQQQQQQQNINSREAAPGVTGELSALSQQTRQSHQQATQFPVLVENSSSVEEERAYPSYARISHLVKCLLSVFEWRITTADMLIERNYMQWAADTIKLTNLLLDLLESDHTFHSMQREILSVLMRMHSDSNMNLYILNPDRDTVMDQRVSLNENTRLKLWKPFQDEKSSVSDDSKGYDHERIDSMIASPRNNNTTMRAITAAIAAKVKPVVRHRGVPFPILRYVTILLELFQTNTSIETYYVLCEGLSHQLGNTYLFGVYDKETTNLLSYLISYLKNGICGQDTRLRVSSAEKSKITTYAYGLLISIMNPKDFLTRELEDLLIATFRDGLIVTTDATSSSQSCLHALSVAMLELPPAMMRTLSFTLQQLAKIYSAANLSVHLIEFVSSLSREQDLHSNLRSQDYRMIFAVAINYIRFHNNQRRREANLSSSMSASTPTDTSGNSSNMSSRASSSHLRQSSNAVSGAAGNAANQAQNNPMSLTALNQYVLVMAYQVINVYYLSLNPGLKAETVDHLILGLLQSNYSQDSLDESNEVCLDMILHNFNRTSNDILKQADAAVKENFGAVVERSWIQHNGIVTIRAQTDGPLAQIMVRSPSGSSSRIVNLAEEIVKKRIERESLPLSPPPPPLSAMPTTMSPGAFYGGPNTMLAPQPPSSPAPGMMLRGRSISRNRRLHSLVISGPSGSGADNDTLPIDSVRRLLRGELVQQSGSMIRAARLPIRFGAAPCLAQEFIAAYPGLQNIDPPAHLPTDLEAIARTLRVFDNTSTIDAHKASVAYVGPGQTTEQEILLNQQGSPAYWAFLRGLGRITRLSRSKGFSAGLDTSGQDGDGRYTITWRDLVGKLVFHVGTLMPAQKGEQEKLLRKKAHMGNDYVHIVFNESGKEYEFDTIHTQFNFVQIIVTPVDGQTSVQEDEDTASWSPQNKSNSNDGDYDYDNDSGNNNDDPSYKAPKFEQLYKVKTQVNPDVPFVGPAMEPKLLGLSALPLFVRSVAIHAALFSQVYSSSNFAADTHAAEFISPWRARLRMIKRIRAQAQKETARKSMSAVQQQPQPQPQFAGSPGGTNNLALLARDQADLAEFGNIVSDPSEAKTASQALGFLIKDLETFYGRM